MFTALFALYGLAQTALLVWGVRLWWQGRSAAALMTVLPILFLPYDNFVIALGNVLGQGALLKNLSWVRFAAHFLVTPLWIIALGSLLRLANFSWVKNKWGLMLFCLLATGLIVGLDAPKLMGLELYPACYADTLRYSENVSATQLCAPNQPIVPSSGPPLATIITMIVILLGSIALWIRLKWFWLFVGSLIMFITAALPLSVFGPAPSSGGEIFIAASMLATVRLLQRSNASTQLMPK